MNSFFLLTAQIIQNRKPLRTSLAVILVCWFFASLACAGTIESRGLYRHLTSSDCQDFDYALPISGGGKAYTTDYCVSQLSEIDDAAHNQTFRHTYINPSGRIVATSSQTYNADTDCWAIDWYGNWCGNPSRPELESMYWESRQLVLYGEPGIWTVELYNGDQLVHTDNFELIPFKIEAASGQKQTIPVNSTSPEALRVKISNPYADTIPANIPVQFSLIAKPKGVKEVVGLTANYSDPPSRKGVNALTVYTDSEGFAQVYLEVGSKTGAYTVQATSAAAANSPPVSFVINVTTADPLAGLVPQKNFGINPDGSTPCVANPINAATGNKMQSETDYQGAGPFPLIFQRSYNSLNVETTTIGSNWRHSYERSITAAREGKGKNAKQVATAHRPDGKEYKFVQNGSEWVPDPDVTDKLAQTSTGWSYLNSSNIMEEYDNAGQLVMLTNLQGLYQTLEYDPNGRLVSVQDQFGRALSFTYNTSGRIGSITDPAAGQYSFAYNAGGNLQSVTYPDLSSRVYLYENTAYPHALTGIVDENNVRYATWKYDAKGRAIASSHAGEADIYALAYFADPVTAVTEPSGIVRRRGYEVVQGVAKKTTLDNGCQTCGSDSSNITYDTATGFITSRTDFNGNRTEYIINARGLEESRTEGAGSPEARTITTAWHPDYRLPVLVTESDKETRLDYAGGKLIKKTEKDRKTGEVRAWSYTYNAIGLLETADGPRTDLIDVTRFNYDTQGNLQFMINPLNQTVTLPLYNENGQPLRVVDPNGLITDITYNSRRLVKSITTGGEQTAYEYDSVGNLRKVSFPDGVGYLTYQYDDAHRRIGLSDQLGNRIKYTLTANGDITKEEALDPGGVLARSRSYVYNQLGRLVQEINAAGLAVKKYDYYGQGNLKSTTDAFANTTNYHFDALNRLVAVVDPLTKTTGYSYDGQDSLQQVVDPNNVSTFYTNNGFGEVLTEDSPDSGFTTYTYDQAGNVAAITDANSKSTIFTYDALNRVVSATHADGSVTTYLYDSEGNASGRLVEINDQAGRTLWVYDQHGRVVGKSQTVAGVTLKIGYRYDESGRMVAMTYPSGAQIGYVYANGQLAGLTLNGQPLLTNVSYEPFGPVAGWTWANNQHQSYQHDLDGYLARHSYGAGLRSLGYDENGRVRSSQDSFQNLLYQYNAVGRLETVTGGQPNQTYRYDANGNRKELVEDASVYAYTFENGSNRIASISGPAPENFTHDAAGNRKSDGSHVYSYDAGNRLSNVDNVAYATNALNLRVAKQAPATTVLFVYDEQGRLRGEYDSSGAAIQETIYLDDIPVATLTGGHVYYIQADHLNSPRIIMDTAGRIVWHWISDPFGTESPDENPDLNGVRFVYNLRFPGQYYDEETGLHYNWHRYYDPLIGRYLTPDPIGLEGGVNLYSYVQNNPVNLIDPWGLFDSYTHKLLTSGVLAKYTASEKVVSRVNQGNVFVDRPENFKNNNEHGMRNFSQSRDDAMLASYNFQKAKMRAAIEAASKCDFEKANFELGQGLHSVQDEIAHDFISLPGHGNPEYIYRDAYSKTDKYSRAKVASEKYVERFVRNLGYHPF